MSERRRQGQCEATHTVLGKQVPHACRLLIKHKGAHHCYYGHIWSDAPRTLADHDQEE